MKNPFKTDFMPRFLPDGLSALWNWNFRFQLFGSPGSDRSCMMGGEGSGRRLCKKRKSPKNLWNLRKLKEEGENKRQCFSVVSFCAVFRSSGRVLMGPSRPLDTPSTIYLLVALFSLPLKMATSVVVIGELLLLCRSRSLHSCSISVSRPRRASMDAINNIKKKELTNNALLTP